MIDNRELLATCWTWAGDAAPARGTERSPIPITERLAAIAATGWEGVGIVHADLVELVSTIGLKNLRTMLDDSGVRYVELEFLTNWWTTGEQRYKADQIRDDLFSAAAELGVTTIKAAAELKSFGAPGAVVYDEFAAAFDALSTRAGTYGLRIAVEPMPMSNLSTISAGAAFVTDVANPHGGLCIDTWHVHRSHTNYAHLIDILPMDHVFVVELTDATAHVVGNLWDDAVDRRLIPGDGAIDVGQFVSQMHRAGWRGHWGVEIISEQHRNLPLLEALQVTRAKTLATIEAADRILADFTSDQKA